LHGYANQLNGVLVFLLLAILPLFGLPVSVLYAIAGAKFGTSLGLVLVSIAIAFHLLGSYWIGHTWLRLPLDRLLQWLRYHKPQVPHEECIPFCLLISLIPGVPYTLKNYLMVLGGVPLRPYFLVSWPVHVVCAALGIFFGDFTEKMTPAKIAFLIGYALVLAGLSRYVVRRLTARQELRAAWPGESQHTAPQIAQNSETSGEPNSSSKPTTPD